MELWKSGAKLHEVEVVELIQIKKPAQTPLKLCWGSWHGTVSSCEKAPVKCLKTENS